MIRQFYREGKEKRRPLEYCCTFFFLSFFALTAGLIFFDFLAVPKDIRNDLIGILAISFIISCFSLIVGFWRAEKVARLHVPAMRFKARWYASKIKKQLKPMYLVKLLGVKKSPYGYPIPFIAVFVDQDCESGWVAIENSPLFNNFDGDGAMEDLSGLLSFRSLRRFGFTSSEISQDENFYIFYFEDVKTSQRIRVKGSLLPFVSQNVHELKLMKNLIWRVDGASPHMAIIGHTRSGKSYFVGHYLLPLMALQGWKIEFYSVKNDLYVDRYHGEYEPAKIVDRLEYWERIMRERNKEIKQAGKEKYSEMPKMPNIALVIDEIGSLNGALTIDRQLKTRWEAVIGKLTATGASAGIHIIAMSQYGTKESFLPTTARANVSDAVIFLGSAADTPSDRQYLLPGFEFPHRNYGVGQGMARIVSAGKRWESPHFFETPNFK